MIHILAEPLHEQSICLEAGAQSRAAQPSCRDAKATLDGDAKG